MDNFDLKKYLAEGRLLKEGIPQESEIADYVEAMFNDSVVEKEGFQSDIWTKEEYAATSRGEGSVFMDLAAHLNSVGGKDALEGNPDIHLELLSNGDIKWSADVTLDEDVIKENEEQGYTLYDTKVEYDNGKTGYMIQLVNSEDGEENEIGFDQLYFDDEDNRLEVGVDFNSFDQGSYQEGEYTADEAMELYRKINENLQDHSDEEELELDADHDKGGKYYSEEGAEAFRIQPFKQNDIEYTKDQAVRQGKYIVGLKGEELKKFISDYMAAWKEDKGDTPEGKTFKENKDYKNDYANSEEDFTDEMVVQKIKDIIKYHELDPQDLIDEIRIEFGVDAMD